MTLQLIHATVSPEHVTSVEAAVQNLFADLEAQQPAGVRYASTKAEDGVTYGILLEVDDPAHNPLAGIESFRRFQEQLPQWLAGPPHVQRLDVIASYRLF